MDIQNRNDTSKRRPLIGVRYIQTFLLFTGLVFMTMLGNEMSLAIVAMTDSSQNNTFDWNHQTQSLILSSQKWGSILAKIPIGILSTRFGGKIVLTGSAIAGCILSVVMPTVAYYGGWQAVCVCKLIQGIATGALLSITLTLTGRWVPVEERARHAAVSFCGLQVGTALEFMIAGLLAATWGWPAIFYANATLLAIWTVIYIFLGSASPQDSKMISEVERQYIQSSLGQTNQRKHLKTPWKAMMTSFPFWVLIMVHCGSGWSYYTLLLETPTYISKVLGVNIKSNGLLSALPYIGSAVFTVVFGIVSDHILAKSWLSVTNCRKLNNSIALYGGAVILIGLSYVTSDVTLAVILLIICSSVKAGTYTGMMLVPLDLAPNYGGTMIGISGFASNAISVFAPIAAGYLILDETLSSEWRKVFFLSAAMNTVANTIFLLFGTCEKQKWNDMEETRKSPSDSKKQRA